MIYAVHQYQAPLADQRAECRRMLAKLLLQHGIDDPDPTVEHEPSGRPCLPQHPGINISLSHCRSHVAVAMSTDGPIGIDVECRRRVNPALVARVCNADEQRAIATAADPEMEFVRLWTRKEAYLKQLGTGIQGFGSLPDTEAKSAADGLETTTLPLGDAYISLCHKPLDVPTSA